MPDTAAQTMRIKEEDIRERKRQAGMVVREILHARRAKKYDQKEAERDRETKAAIDKKSGSEGRTERNDFDATKGEKHESGRIVEIDERELSELEMPEQKSKALSPESERGINEKAPSMENRNMPTSIHSEKGLEVTVPGRTPVKSLSAEEKDHIKTIRGIYQKSFENLKKSAEYLKIRNTEQFSNGSYSMPSQVFSRMKNEYADKSYHDYFATLEKISVTLENSLTKDLFQDYERTIQDFVHYREQVEEYQKSRTVPALVNREQGDYTKVKEAIRNDLKKSVEDRSKTQAIEHEKKTVVANVSKETVRNAGKETVKAAAKQTVKAAAKTAAKSHPIPAIISTAVEKATDLVKGRDMERSFDARDFTPSR